jgi:biopolymer transport protein ExbD
MRLPDEPELPPQINIVPMIDIIFAILTFFILSTLFLTRSEGLPVNLPKAKNTVQTQTPETTRATVTISATGELALDRKPVQLDTLEQQMRDIVAGKRQVLVVLNADEAVSHGQVIAVMDRLRGIEGVKLAIATTRP